MNEYVNQAMAMMQKVIAAATPIAAKAWEISMLTLQIDALATMVPFILLIVGSVVAVVLLRRYRAQELLKYEQACKALEERNALKLELAKANGMRYYDPERQPSHREYSSFDGMGLVLTWMAALTPGIIGVAALCNVWLWVKLFQPELWLAHAAIEKLVK